MENDVTTREIEERNRRAEDAAKEANETSRLLSGQLIVITGFFIAFTTGILANSDLAKRLNSHGADLLILAWILLSTSLALGITEILTDITFFIKQSEQELKIAQDIARDGVVDTVQSGGISTRVFLYLQIVFLGLGSVAFLALASFVLLSS